MTKSLFTTLLILILLIAWFAGVVFFYDHDADSFKMTYREKKDQAAINLLNKSEIDIYDDQAAASVSILFSTPRQ